MTISIPNRRICTGASALSVAAIILGSAFATTANAADKPISPPAIPTVQATQAVAGTSAPATDQFIVKFKSSASNDKAARAKTYDRAARDTSIKVKEVKAAVNNVQVVKANHKLDATEVQQVQKSIATADNVVSVEPDILMQPTSTPNDSYYSKQWNLTDPNVGIRVPSVWDNTKGAGQIVAVIDTGITAHSDLNSNVIAGYDMVTPTVGSRDSDPRDADASDPGNYKVAGDCGTATTANSTWHGTHVAGIIAAVGNNAKGITGVAPGVKIEPIRALGECGGYLSDVMDGITWASGGTVPGVPVNANPAKTINLSIGGQAACYSSFQSVIDAAVQRGSSIFVAAGNENQPAANLTPANCNNVIVVGASNQSGNKASYSNYGSAVDIMAPGGDTGAGILSTYNSGTTAPGAEAYGYMMGTSMASPTAAAVGALMKAADPTLTPAQIESKLKATAHSLPGTCAGGCGAGLIDASAAVKTPIAVKATSLNGSLGSATGSVTYGLKNGGSYQSYQRGVIVYSPASGAHVSMGGIRSTYASTGFENGDLGYPTSDEIGGLKNGGVYQSYQGGAIVYSSATGAHVSMGAIRSAYAASGYENGKLGYPTTNEIGGLKNGGVYQNYQGGAIVYSPATGAHLSVGAIRGMWAKIGYENGKLGYPTSNEYSTGNGGVAQNYQGGVIHWSPSGSYIS